MRGETLLYEIRWCADGVRDADQAMWQDSKPRFELEGESALEEQGSPFPIPAMHRGVDDFEEICSDTS